MSKFMTSKEKKEKKRHQVKSQFYYIFWGTATVAVCAGQIVVGGGFRRMADSFEKVLDSPIHVDFGIPRYRFDRHDWEDDTWYHPTHPPQKLDPSYQEDFEKRL